MKNKSLEEAYGNLQKQADETQKKPATQAGHVKKG